MIKVTKNVEEANAVTHSGTFHADDILATVILSKIRGDITVFRTFEVPDNLAENVIVYDIGFGEFDHHQKGGNGFRNNGIPYASSGLIWRKFGYELVKDTIDPKFIWKKIDKFLIQGVDATDNGTMPKTQYPAQSMSFSQIISSFNPTWNSDKSSDEFFEKAVEFASVIFDNIFEKIVAKAKAKIIVEDAIKMSENHIMVLEHFVPWQEFILSSLNSKAEDIQFVVFPSKRGGYNWQCVKDDLGSYQQRKDVPDEWKGLNGEELQKVTGIKTATFCHPTGFIGGAETIDGALAMVRKAVEA